MFLHLATKTLKDITVLLINAKKILECQFDRLIKLLYHILVFLNKCKDVDEFSWFADNILFICKADLKSKQNNGKISNDPERNNIYIKIFEMHWTLSTKIDAKILAENELDIRLHGFLFILETKQDLMKFGKYLENCITKFIIDNKNKNTIASVKTSSKIAALLGTLYNQMLLCDETKAPITKSTIAFLVCLLYEFIILFGNCKDCLLPVTTILSTYPNSVTWVRLHYVINEAYRTKLVFATSVGDKVKRDRCKQAKTFKQLLVTVGAAWKEFLKPMMDPKLIVFCEITKTILTMKETLCWNTLIDVCNFTKLACRLVYLTQEKLSSELNNVKMSLPSDMLNKSITSLCTPWYSFLCWFLQIVAPWLSRTATGQKDEHCSCLSKSPNTK